MGKKRIAVLGEELSSTKVTEGKEKKSRRPTRSVDVEDARHEVSAKKQKIVQKEEIQNEIVEVAEKEKKDEKIETENTEEKAGEEKIIENKKAKVKKPAKKRGKNYLEAKKKIDKNKSYSISEAIKLLSNISFSKFKGSVDAHINVKETGLKGEIQFPHSTGKKQTIRIVDENLLKDLEKGLTTGKQGKIDFTLLIAEPKMMPRLVKFAKLLGPRGLMPNPKNGTVTEKPEEAVKNMAGKIQFKTEAKYPLIHIAIGHINDSEKDLVENFQALTKAVGKRNISKAFISPTMGPSLKIDLGSF